MDYIECFASIFFVQDNSHQCAFELPSALYSKSTAALAMIDAVLKPENILATQVS